MKVAIVVLVAASVVACRDVSRSPGGPDFSVAADSGGGPCDAKACQFNARGQAAYVDWYSSVPPTDTGSGGGVQRYGYLNVARNASQTFLYYGVTECTSWGCMTAGGGYGTIPNADLTGNTRSMHLSTNTTDNPNFITYAGPSGSIEVTWVANGLFEYHSNGTTQLIQPGFSQRQVGQSDDVSANASGRVTDSFFSAATGSMSSNHNVTITINR